MIDIQRDYLQPELGNIGSVARGTKDIGQCIRTILLTMKGSVPHRPDFGTDIWKFVDYPVRKARAQIVSEVVNALERWEPRVAVSRVVVEQTGVEQLGITVYWMFSNTQDINMTEVIL